MNNLFKLTLFISLFFFLGCETCPPVAMEPCGLTPERPQVDLIVLIDASGSMGPIASIASAAAVSALDSSQLDCETDLVVHYLGVDGVWSGTQFTTSHKQFIFTAQGGTVSLASDALPLGLGSELGAHAIEDLSVYAPWRPGACRAILYISDEELDGSIPLGDVANENAATADAIAAALGNQVTVFTNYILQNNRGPAVMQNYDDLAGQTGGFNQTTASTNDVNEDLYLDLMPRVVCNACNACVLGQLEN